MSNFFNHVSVNAYFSTNSGFDYLKIERCKNGIRFIFDEPNMFNQFNDHGVFNFNYFKHINIDLSIKG